MLYKNKSFFSEKFPKSFLNFLEIKTKKPYTLPPKKNYPFQARLSPALQNKIAGEQVLFSLEKTIKNGV
jgi:hypothetical protein